MSRFVDQMDEVIFYDEVVSKADYPDDLDIDEILASLNLDVFAMTQEELEDALEDVMRDGGRIALSQIGIAAADEKIVERVNQRALTWAKERAADLVNLGDDGDPLLLEATRSMLRATIASGIENNLSTKDIGELIEENYAFSEDRAQLIAATEITSANSMGALASYEEAAAEGVSVKKSWLILEDACDICQENADAGAIDLDEEFPSGDMAPGAHPNCRCVLVPEVEDESGNVTQGDGEEAEDFEKSDFDESKVERDDKGRFSGNGGGGLPEFFHGTDFAKEIQEKGFEIRTLGSARYGAGVYLAEDRGYASDHGDQLLSVTVSDTASVLEMSRDEYIKDKNEGGLFEHLKSVGVSSSVPSDRQRVKDEIRSYYVARGYDAIHIKMEDWNQRQNQIVVFNPSVLSVKEVEKSDGKRVFFLPVSKSTEEEGEEVEKSDFDESKVERDENGRFSSGGGGDDISVEVSEIPDAEDMFGVPTDSEDGEWKENRITFQEADDQYNGFLNSGADAIKEAIGNAKLEPIFPDNLVSNQTSVDSGKLIAIAANPKSEPIVVVRTNTGDYVYDGNHRASVASILGDHVEAKVVDVSSS